MSTIADKPKIIHKMFAKENDYLIENIDAAERDKWKGLYQYDHRTDSQRLKDTEAKLAKLTDDLARERAKVWTVGDESYREGWSSGNAAYYGAFTTCQTAKQLIDQGYGPAEKGAAG